MLEILSHLPSRFPLRFPLPRTPRRPPRAHARRPAWTILPLVLAALCVPAAARAELGYDDAQAIALERAPAIAMQREALAGAQAQQPAADTLPDPRLSIGVENFPVGGADRYSLTRDFMTMQRLGVMQDVPNRAKREARAAGAQARVQREQALLAVARLAVRRDAGLAWLAVRSAERRAALLDALEQENRLTLATLNSRIATGKAMPADRTMAQQETLALADRRDDARRDIARARAALRGWVGARADETLAGDAPALTPDSEALRDIEHRHAEITPYEATLAMARAEAGEADADQRGDWSWEFAYSRRGPQYGDMVSVQVRFDLPWARERRQLPVLAAKQREIDRLGAERAETLRKHREEIEGQLAELQALDAQHARLATAGLKLAGERVALMMAAYESGRADLGGVIAARRDVLEARMRLIDLDAQRAALRIRLTTLIAE
jgi:outer membrane protein TolC